MNVSLHHIGIASRDISRSLEFYVRLLGGTVTPMAGHLAVTAGDVCIAVIARREDDPARHAYGAHIALRVDAKERSRLLECLAGLGAEHDCVDERIYTRDPDGLALELVLA